MGWLIAGHAFRKKPNMARVSRAALPFGLWLYKHRTEKLYLIDLYKGSLPSITQFSQEETGISRNLLPCVDTLETLYKHLKSIDNAVGFEVAHINFALILNRLFKIPVFSFASDDDQTDFACTVEDGQLVRLNCQCEDIRIVYENGDTTIQPLIPEMDSADEDEAGSYLTNSKALRAAVPGVRVLNRDVDWVPNMHEIAMREWQLFSGTSPDLLGMGSFDPPDVGPDWVLIEGIDKFDKNESYLKYLWRTSWSGRLWRRFRN